MRYPLRISTNALAAALVLAAFGSAAYDQEIASTLSAVGYSIPTPAGEWVSRRRFVEDLTLSAWNLLPGSADPYYRGPRLAIAISLRLDADADVGTSESSPSSERSYVPGLSPIGLDAMIAYVDIADLWQETLDVRAGRQIRVDTLGFFAFDGVETRLHLPAGIGLDTYLGYEVRGGDVLGYDALELDGTDSGGRHDMPSDRYPDRTDPDARLAAGAEASFSPRRWLHAAAAFRAIGLTGSVADSRVGGRLGLGGAPVRADGDIAFGIAQDRIAEANGELAVTPVDPLTVAAEYHYFVPVFEADSIFNVFDLAPANDVGGRAEIRLGQALALAIFGYARLSDRSLGISGEEADAAVSGAGGGLGCNYRTPEAQVSARVSAVGEQGEQRIGAELGAGHGFFHGERLWLAARVSVWRLEDEFSERLSGNMGGYVLSARYEIDTGAYVLGEFEQYVGEARDPRFVFLALLQLDLWR